MMLYLIIAVSFWYYPVRTPLAAFARAALFGPDGRRRRKRKPDCGREGRLTPRPPPRDCARGAETTGIRHGYVARMLIFILTVVSCSDLMISCRGYMHCVVTLTGGAGRRLQRPLAARDPLLPAGVSSGFLVHNPARRRISQPPHVASFSSLALVTTPLHAADCQGVLLIVLRKLEINIQLAV